MHQHLVLGVVGVLALGPIAAPAQASPSPSSGAEPRAVRETVTQGRTVSYKAGKLRVAAGKKRLDFVVTKTSSCGYSRGNRGTSMRCSRLGQKKYMNKSVRIAWYTDAKKRRVASIVAVILSR
jgi:hypothetical protein